MKKLSLFAMLLLFVGFMTLAQKQTEKIEELTIEQNEEDVEEEVEPIPLIEQLNEKNSGQWDGSTTVDNNIWRTGNVGIGTSSPAQKLDINGNLRLQGGTRYLYFTGGNAYVRTTDASRHIYFQAGGTTTRLFISGSNGNVGIGTVSPAAKLDITSSDHTGFRLVYNNTVDFSYASQIVVNRSTTKALALQNSGQETFVLFGDGSMALGPVIRPYGYMLSVAGKIIAEEVEVKLRTNWPDYVFQPEYNLRTLSEVEQHIQAYGHLPEMPSAQQVEEKGISVGEMNALLLKKIEELTLYMIELKKENVELRESFEKHFK